MGQPTRRLLARVVLWQPSSGAIIDLPSRAIGTTTAPSRSESRATMSDGSASVVSRGTSAEIPLGDIEARVMSRVFKMNDCPVKAAFLGLEGTEHALWLEPTRINVQWPDLETGRSRITVDMETSIFSPAIWRGMDLIEGVPWQNTESQQRQDKIQLRYPGTSYRPGYEGPAFKSNLGASVDMRGATSGLDEAEMRFEFPVWGSTLKLSAIKGYTLQNALLNILNWEESVMKSVPPETEVTVPREAFFVEVKIGTAGGRPRVDLISPGTSEGVVYTGSVRPDCTRGSKPPWEELPFPNKAPRWEQREDLVFSLDNVAPILDCDSFTVQGTKTGGANAPPLLACDDYTLFREEGGEPFKYTAPTVGDTSFIYTSTDGFTRIDFDLIGTKIGGANSEYKSNFANGEVAVDENAGAVFVAHPDGVFKFNLDGTGETQIITDTGSDAFGVAVDPLTTTLYVSYEGKSGIFTYAYDGSGETQIVSDGVTKYSLAVAPDGGDGGLLFGASESSNQVKRWDLSGENDKMIRDLSSAIRFLKSNVHLHLEEAFVYWQESKDGNEREIYRASFDGSGVSSLFLVVSTQPGLSEKTEWTILQDEKKWVEIEESSSGVAAEVETRDLDGSGKQTIGSISKRTGKYLASSQPISSNAT